MGELIKYDAACQAIAACRATDEVMAWADKAAALQAYGRMAKDKSLETDAAEIRIRAERQLGKLLAEQKAGPGLNKGGRPSEQKPVATKDQFSDDRKPVLNEDRFTDDEQTPPTLAQAGISKNLSSRAQKLAAVPDAEFESEVRDWRGRVEAEGARVSARLQQAGDRELGKAQPPPPSELDELRDQLAEMTAMCDELRADNESMAKVFEANEQVQTALAEAKKYREQARIAESRITGLMNEKNELVRRIKGMQRTIDKLEKASGSGVAA